jgi:hypothetical protein
MQQPGRRRWRAVARATLLGGLAAAAAVSPAVASGPPPGRAYELVSPSNKGGSPVTGSVMTTATGGAVVYSSLGAFGDAPSSIGANYVARRTETGWASRTANPPVANDYIPNAFDEFYVMGGSADLSRILIDTSAPASPDDHGFTGTSATSSDIYRLEPDGAFSFLTAKTPLPDASGEDSGYAGVSADGKRVVFESLKALHPDVAADGTRHIYIHDGDTIHLVSRGFTNAPLAAGGVVGRSANINFGASSWKDGRFPFAVSEDASRIYFVGNAGVANQLLLRKDAVDPAEAETVWVSESEITPGTGCAAVFVGANRDGSVAYFYCETPLDDDNPTEDGLYRYDATTGDVALVANHIAGSGGASPAVLLGQDRDANYIYFVSRRQLVPEASVSQWNFYVIDHGELKLIKATTNTTGQPDDEDASVSSDGSAIVFESAWALDDDADNGGRAQVYLYDADAPAAAEEDKLICVSCRTDGSPTQGAAGVRDMGLPGFGPTNNVRPFGNVSDDARTVFFTSADALVDGDTNGVADAYVWEDGEHRLLTSGKDPHPSIFMGASANHVDAFVLTHENLVPEDVDNGVADLYSVRLGGGFAAKPKTAPCQGEACRPPAPAPPVFTPPPSAVVADEGNASPPTRASFDALRMSAATRRDLARGRTVSLRVKVNKAGTIRVRGRARIGRRTLTIASASRKVTKAGTYSVRVRLSRTARRHLNRGRRVRATFTVSFTGVREPEQTTLTLTNRKRNGR